MFLIFRWFSFYLFFVAYRETFQERFGDIIGKLNFIGDAEGSRHHINEFVEHITKNHIREILQPGDITPHTNFVVANAAYFHGKWFSKFNVNQTEWKDFSGTENVGKVEMMHQRGKFMHGWLEFINNIFVLPFSIFFSKKKKLNTSTN